MGPSMTMTMKTFINSSSTVNVNKSIKYICIELKVVPGLKDKNIYGTPYNDKIDIIKMQASHR